jgi:hypothetical protein
MSSRVDEEQTTMNTGIGDMSISKGSKLLSKVSRVLVFDLFVSLPSGPREPAGHTYLTIGSQQLSLLIISP